MWGQTGDVGTKERFVICVDNNGSGWSGGADGLWGGSEYPEADAYIASEVLENQSKWLQGRW